MKITKWNRYGKKGPWPALRYCLGISLGALRKAAISGPRY
jgi:hypothetical protein